ncbi:MAG: diguanylate cyclase [Desulfatiglandaceae bacterium]
MRKLAHILLIEDNPDHAELVESALKSDFRVYWAQSGKSGLEYLKGLPVGAMPDLILIDYSLPGFDGLRVIESIIREGLDIPLIMITGQGDEEIAVRAMKLGAYDYVVKTGNDLGVLPVVIHRALERHKTAREKVRLEEELKRLSITDDLTGLFNRRYFYNRIQEETVRAERYGTPLSVVLFDLDHFKRYNDTHGHLEGDHALKRVAEVIRQNTRNSVDFACRYGGDEFAVIMPGIARAGAHITVERIQRAVRDIRLGDITVSAGMAEYEKEAPIEAFIESADRMLYREKREGG